jgi:hypothetical protein
VVNLQHQGQEAAYFPIRKSLARKPGQVVSRQIRQQRALVFAERHGNGDELL